jgi:hypothetical protein
MNFSNSKKYNIEKFVHCVAFRSISFVNQEINSNNVIVNE